MLGAVSEDAMSEPKPKRIKVRCGDKEQGFKMSENLSAEDAHRVIARFFGFSSPDSLTLTDADGDAVVPSHGNLTDNQTYTVHSAPNPTPSDAPHLHLRIFPPFVSL